MMNRRTQAKTTEELQRALAPTIARLWDEQAFRLTQLAGDASTRIYHRLETVADTSRSLIVMELGADPLRSDEIADSERPQELPFYEVQRFLAAGGIAVPEIYAYLRDDGLLVLEDLGDRTLASVVTDGSDEIRERLYRQAIDLLVRMQRYAERAPRECTCFHRRFDRNLLRWELDHFREWLLEEDRGIRLEGTARAELDDAFDDLVEQLVAMPQGWVHRDYQSRNLMLQPVEGDWRLRVIDFQDALMGPFIYDLVGLLRDSYVDLGLPLVSRLVDYYRQQACPQLELAELERLFWLQTVQRKLKDAGRFVFIDRVRGNPNFLQYIPTSLRYVSQALERLPQEAGAGGSLASVATCLERVSRNA